MQGRDGRVPLGEEGEEGVGEPVVLVEELDRRISVHVLDCELDGDDHPRDVEQPKTDDDETERVVFKAMSMVSDSAYSRREEYWLVSY